MMKFTRNVQKIGAAVNCFIGGIPYNKHLHSGFLITSTHLIVHVLTSVAHTFNQVQASGTTYTLVFEFLTQLIKW